MIALPSPKRARLAAALELASRDTTPTHERLAALGGAHRILEGAGITWLDVITPAPVHREPLQSKWRTTCAELMRHQAALRPWERRFVADLPNFRRISSKQRYVLFEIAARVLGEELAA